MHDLLVYLTTSFGISVETGFRYALAAGIAWLFFYVLFKGRWRHRKIIPGAPLSSEVWRECQYSVLTLLIFGAVGATTWFLIKAGHSQMYFGLRKHGWGWFWTSIVLAIVIHDTYFYWTHRLMHHPRLFRSCHRTHHLSTNPTPWAAYAFSPIEAVVQAGVFPLVVMLVPIHPLGFFVFMVWQISFNVVGHAGFEIYPRWMLDSWIGKILNTPTNHVMHHEFFRGNYGLYFNVWDRLMGTNHEKYEDRFRAVTTRKPEADATVPEAVPSADDLVETSR